MVHETTLSVSKSRLVVVVVWRRLKAVCCAVTVLTVIGQDQTRQFEDSWVFWSFMRGRWYWTVLVNRTMDVSIAQ